MDTQSLAVISPASACIPALLWYRNRPSRSVNEGQLLIRVMSVFGISMLCEAGLADAGSLM